MQWVSGRSHGLIRLAAAPPHLVVGVDSKAGNSLGRLLRRRHDSGCDAFLLSSPTRENSWHKFSLGRLRARPPPRSGPARPFLTCRPPSDLAEMKRGKPRRRSRGEEDIDALLSKVRRVHATCTCECGCGAWAARVLCCPLRGCPRLPERSAPFSRPPLI